MRHPGPSTSSRPSTKTYFPSARTAAFALVLAYTATGPLPLSAEVLAPPPLPIDVLVPSGATSPSGTSWLLLRRTTDASGAPKRDGGSSHNYDYDLGVDFTFLTAGCGGSDGTGRFGVHGMVRMIFESEQPTGWSENTWLIDSASIVVEQSLRVSVGTGLGVLALGFHHNSKHDLDRGRRRTPIHDAIRFDWRSPVFASLYAPALGWTAGVSARGEYALPPIFQSETPEPYAGGVYLHVTLEPVVYDDRIAVFVEGRLAVIANSLGDERWLEFDRLFRVGVRTGGSPVDGRRRVGYGVFFEVHHLNDDWRTLDSIGPDRLIAPWTLVSVGVMAWR